MPQHPSYDRSFPQLMRRSKLELPFGDFEETVMQRISQENARKQVVSRDRKLSFLFFILGTSLGLFTNSIFQKTQVSFLDLPPETTVLVFQFGFVLLFLFQLQKNLPLLKSWKDQLLRK